MSAERAETPTGYSLGRVTQGPNTYNYTGKISAVLVYTGPVTGPLSATDRQLVERYLYGKYIAKWRDWAVHVRENGTQLWLVFASAPGSVLLVR